MTYVQEWKAFDVTVADGVAEVTLIGPGKGNAMGPDFWSELVPLFGALDVDGDVRAVVLTGSGKNFSYGLDLPAMAGDFGKVLADNAKARPRTEFHDTIKRMQAGINAVADCRKPVIAAVAGWCIGGGVDLITAADIRLASADAKFSVREVRVAIVADMGSLARLGGINEKVNEAIRELNGKLDKFLEKHSELLESVARHEGLLQKGGDR